MDFPSQVMSGFIPEEQEEEKIPDYGKHACIHYPAGDSARNIIELLQRDHWHVNMKPRYSR
jgi:hypothetical protein